MSHKNKYPQDLHISDRFEVHGCNWAADVSQLLKIVIMVRHLDFTRVSAAILPTASEQTQVPWAWFNVFVRSLNVNIWRMWMHMFSLKNAKKYPVHIPLCFIAKYFYGNLNSLNFGPDDPDRGVQDGGRVQPQLPVVVVIVRPVGDQSLIRNISLASECLILPKE